MKKGCFIKIIFILTIFTAAVVYIIQNHFDELILEPGKNLIKNFVISGLDVELKMVENDPLKDSLEVMVSSFLEYEFEHTDRFSNKEYDWMVDSLRVIVRDSILTSDELENFNILLHKNKSDERPKKN